MTSVHYAVLALGESLQVPVNSVKSAVRAVTRSGEEERVDERAENRILREFTC